MSADSTLPPSAGDARTAYRVALEQPVRIQFDAAAAYREGMLGNVSTSGMYVRVAEPPPVGALVRFEIDFGEEEAPLRGTGEVVWIRVRWEERRPPGMGIRFRYLEDDGEPRLAAAIAALARREPAAVQTTERDSPRPPGFGRERETPEPEPPLPPAPEIPKERPSARERLTALLGRSEKSPPSPAAPPPRRPAPREPRAAPPAAEKKVSGRQIVILAALLVVLLILLMRLS